MFPISYISAADMNEAARRLGVDFDAISAVTEIEARGSGFLRNSDRPVILFEGHKFHKFTDGKFSASHPTISYPKWTKAHYRGGAREYDRLIEAMRLNEGAALNSASVGMFQIMGFNHRACGFATVHDFWNDQALGEDRHLQAFVSFVLANDAMLAALRSHDWAGFARRYNGPGYASNQYDTKLAAAVARARRIEDEEPLRGDIAALQAALNVAVRAELAVDGWMGPNTAAAIATYQSQVGIPASGNPDVATRTALGLLEEKETA